MDAQIERQLTAVIDDLENDQPMKTRSKKARLQFNESSLKPLRSVMKEFYLSTQMLKEMCEKMTEYMNNGLKGLPKATIAMHPSFIPKLPDGSERGRFIAIDLGGTNLRVMLVEIDGEKIEPKVKTTPIPDEAKHGTGQQLFAFIAKSLRDFLRRENLIDEKLSLGFTFSFPCVQTSLRSAKLVKWTKDFDVSDVVGRDVASLLEDAIRRYEDINVKVVAVINDTVGTMIAAAAQNNGVCHLAVVIATGTNAAYMEKAKNVKGLEIATEMYQHKEVIINTEWGGFAGVENIATSYDKVVDEQSKHRSVNVFDKLVGGMCMGEVVRLVLERLIEERILLKRLIWRDDSNPLLLKYSFPTKYISQILRDESGSYSNTRRVFRELDLKDYSVGDMRLLREVCSIVSHRSAKLAAAAIASVLNRIGIEGFTMVVAIEGATYKYLPGYKLMVTEQVVALLKPGLKFTIIETEDGSGKGAALAAALADKIVGNSSSVFDVPAFQNI